MIGQLYAEELRWLRDSGRAFAAAHPRTAAHLADPGQDPDVDRLLEGVAFLCARTRMRTDELGSDLVQAALLATAPHLVRPWPAMAMLRFRRAPGIRGTPVVPSGTLVESAGPAPCRFRTAWEGGPAWAEVVSLTIEAGDPPRLEIRLSRGGAMAAGPCDRLRLHCHGDHLLACALRQALLTSPRVATILPGGSMAPLRVLPAGFGPGEAVLPSGHGLGPGHAHLLLSQLAAYPEALRSVELSGPPRLGSPPSADEIRIVADLSVPPGQFAGAGPGNLLAGCVPAVNLWAAPSDPLVIDGTRRSHRLAVAGCPEALPWGVVRVVGQQRGREPREWPGLAAGPGPGPRWQELRRAAPTGTASELWLEHGQPDDLADGEVVSAALLAHDGARTAGIGIGDIRVPGGAMPGGIMFANLDRPSPAHEPVLGGQPIRRLAQRLRLVSGGIRTVEDLRACLACDDPRDPGSGPVAGDQARRSAAIRSLRVTACAEPVGGAPVRTLRHEVEVDEDAFAGCGGAALFGECLSTALAHLAPLNAATALTLRCARGGWSGSWPARFAGAVA